MNRGRCHLLAGLLALAAPARATAQEVSRDEPRQGVRVRISVAADEPGATRLWVDGEELPRDAWARPIVVPAGELVVRAERPGRTPVRVTLRAVEGATVIVPIRWPEPRAAPTPAPPPRPVLSAWTVFGSMGVVLGGVALAVGGYFLAETVRQRDDTVTHSAWTAFNYRVNPSDASGARALDSGEVCDRAQAQRYELVEAAAVATQCEQNARSRAFAWAFGAGGVALVALGVTGVLLAPRRTPPRVQATPLVTPAALGAAITVRF